MVDSLLRYLIYSTKMFKKKLKTGNKDIMAANTNSLAWIDNWL